MSEWLPNYLVPLWVVWVVLGVVLCVGVAVAKQIPTLGKRILFVLILVTDGIIVAASGPFSQYLFETIWDWGSPKWAFLYLRSLGPTQTTPFFLSLLVWGILPGSLAALAAIWFRDWPRKVIGSSIAASIVFIAIDVAQVIRESQEHLDLGYIININVVGGVVAGVILASSAVLLERAGTSQLSFSAVQGKYRRPLLGCALAVLVLPYLIWYFFLDHPTAMVWVKLANWTWIDSSKPGHSLSRSKGEWIYTGESQWVTVGLEKDLPASLDFPFERQVLHLKALPSISVLADYRKPEELRTLFKEVKDKQPIKHNHFEIRGGLAEAWLVPNGKGPVSFYIDLASFDFMRIHRVESQECRLSFFGRPFGTRGKLTVTGTFDVYVNSWSNGPLAVTTTSSGKRVHLYNKENTTDLIQLKANNFANFKYLAESFQLSSCESVAKSLTSSEFLRVQGAEGMMRLGIEPYELGVGSSLLLGNAVLGIENKEGAILVSGNAKEVRLNGVTLNESRWGRMSIEMKTTLIAALIGALGASVGWLVRQRTGSKQD